MLNEENIIKEFVLRTASKMAAAARTAPKGRGIDNIVIKIAEKNDILELSDYMKKTAEKKNLSPSFFRDAENILSAQALFLIGTKVKSLGLGYCGLCGFKNCFEKPENTPCAFNTGDLGIAIGSAVSIAMDERVDNRIMYTVGIMALEKGLLDKDVKIAYAIPLSVSSKNPFFDRKN